MCKHLCITYFGKEALFVLAALHGGVFKIADFINMLIIIQSSHSCVVSSVGSSPTRGTCEISQVLLAGVQGVFSLGSPVFALPTDWPVLYELKLS